ncbi:MAG: hypothetical protein E5Y89_01575 [Mesorhizobium sp.]|uniref:hypothetical protein n=1 Tax=Mesorhizobium sp. TaxID=1871066 RepID=UPI000FE8C3C3|nr:hypothetical protein [Mesorhizobium sp.]RWD30864.1 MAG: hypothetical protein EOS22_06375 [Mesorhizobium sp.]TIL83230.1 MAG: hypothetical protein E5Y89_01575 [Mesorhizobium sp.]TJW61810.1 MAG: hypothetical protein E5V29_27160 [Mesorhizobium sp.]
MLLEELRAGALPEGVLKRHYILKRLPMVLNDWIARAAVEGAERALADAPLLWITRREDCDLGDGLAHLLWQ